MAQHFDSTQWTDYARNLVDGPSRQAMQVHLDTGCQTCRRRLAVAEAVMALARVEVDQEPPAAAVRIAKAMFPAASSSLFGDLPRTIARMVADSFAQPLPAGVRSTATAPRQVAYEADGYVIDLRIQRERDARDLWLVGQVQAVDANPGPAAHAPVALFRDDAAVARTVCNEFGEFQVHCPAGRGGRLSIAIDGGARRIDIDVAEILSPTRNKAQRDDA